MTQPIRSNFLPFHIPCIEEEEIQLVVETMRSGWLTTGPKSKQFEKEFAQYVGADHAVAVSSGTAALHLALDAIGIESGDEVIVPAMTFAATAEVVHYFKAKPVLIDCDSKFLNIDPDKIRGCITDKTKAIIPVHMAGHPCQMDRIKEISQDHSLKIIEDAAHALPATYRGQKVGTIGDITCFSFYSTKTITTGEGGMVATNNPSYADCIKTMSLHGISKDAWNRYAKEGSWYYEILRPGYKYNLSDIASAIGIAQLKKCDQFREKRKQIALMYNEYFEDVNEIIPPYFEDDVEHSWHLYIIQLKLENLGIDRNSFITLLKEEGIGASVHFIPLHLHPYYRDTYGYSSGHFPAASFAYERIISLPIYPQMNEQDVLDVIKACKKIIKNLKMSPSTAYDKIYSRVKSSLQ